MRQMMRSELYTETKLLELSDALLCASTEIMNAVGTVPKCLADVSYFLRVSLAWDVEEREGFVFGLDKFECSIRFRVICVSSATPLRRVLDSARNIIMTSGSLSPMHCFSLRLKLKFHFSEALMHISNSSCFISTVITHAELPNELLALQGTKSQLENHGDIYYKGVSEIILQLFRAVQASNHILHKLQDYERSRGRIKNGR